MPKMEVHTRGKNREDDDLETVCGGSVSNNVLVGVRSSFLGCVLVEQDVISVLNEQHQCLDARE